MNKELNKYAENIIMLKNNIKELEQQKKLYEKGSVEAVQVLHEIDTVVEDLKDYQIFMRRYFHEVNRRNK